MQKKRSLIGGTVIAAALLSITHLQSESSPETRSGFAATKGLAAGASISVSDAVTSGIAARAAVRTIVTTFDPQRLHPTAFADWE